MLPGSIHARRVNSAEGDRSQSIATRRDWGRNKPYLLSAGGLIARRIPTLSA
jgi:hypothetical protein